MKLQYKLLNLSIVIAMIATTISCNTNSKFKGTMKQIDQLFKERYSIVTGDELIPGGAVLIKKGDEILFDKGYGYSNIFFKEKIDGETNFNIASCTKQFTAAAILKLQDELMLNIDSSIYDISPLVNPYLPINKAKFKNVTIKHLLSHSSGIPDARPRDNRDFVLHATDMQSVEYLKTLDSLVFEPGTQYEYINPTFQILYLYIEKLTGKSFDFYMEDKILRPAGMFSATFFEAEKNIPLMAHGYVYDNESNKWKEYEYGKESFFATKADGGLYCSTHEFLNWINALRDNKIISEYAKSIAWSPITKVSGSPYSDYQNRQNTYYGLGWFIEQQDGYPIKVYHTGDNGGFQIYEGYFPDSDVAVLIFENRNDKPRWELVEKIDKILLDSGIIN